MPPLPFFWVDAFTAHVFAGNPAGVVPLAQWLDDALMQRMATQHGLAETAYFVRTGEARAHLRWFTPEYEIDLCGHATLASAWVWFQELYPGAGGDTVTFDTRSGPLVVRRVAEGRLELDFPARPPVEVPPAFWPADLVAGLAGARPTWVGKSRDYLCVFDDAATVRALRPDFARLARLTDTVGIIVSAPGTSDAPGARPPHAPLMGETSTDATPASSHAAGPVSNVIQATDACDFVSRFFAPGAGVPEDPVTGSAHCTLIPYWAQRLGRTTLHARQVSARGGELWCHHDGDRVRMAGHAATYLRGTILR